MAEEKKASKKIALVPLKKPRSKIVRFLQAAWEIIKNKKDTKKHFTNAALSLITSSLLNIVAVFLAFFSLYGIVEGIKDIIEATTGSFSGIFNGVLQLLIAIGAVLFALIIRGMANEAEREKDSNYLMSLFSGLTGFAALIVALIALSRGVG